MAFKLSNDDLLTVASIDSATNALRYAPDKESALAAVRAIVKRANEIGEEISKREEPAEG